MENNNLNSSSKKRRSPNIEQENSKVKTGPNFGLFGIILFKEFPNSNGCGCYQGIYKYCNKYFRQDRPQYLSTHILDHIDQCLYNITGIAKHRLGDHRLYQH